MCTCGVSNPTRNRAGHNLPGKKPNHVGNIIYIYVFLQIIITAEKFRVILKGETPDYINASYVKVSGIV